MVSVDKEEAFQLQGSSPIKHGGDVWEARRGPGSKQIVDFSSNINPLGPPAEVEDAIRRNLWRISIYPDPAYSQLSDQLAKYLGTVDGSNIIVGNGSTELIYIFAEAFLTPGDRALIPSPTFSEYERAVSRVGAKTVPVPLGKSYELDVDSILRSEEPRVKVVFICNPNNPTGILVPREEFDDLLGMAAERGIMVFLDEAFIEFVDDGERYTLVGEVENAKNLFVLRSLTKVFGLAGLRIGYGAASKECIGVLSDLKPPWNVNCMAEVAALAALPDGEHQRKTRSLLKQERPFLERQLSGIGGLKPIHGKANFILVDARNSGMKGSEIREGMLQRGILVRDCGSFRGLGDYHIRVAIRQRRDNIRLVAALREVIANGLGIP
jgi:threonine-phosphate decarboxylase